MKFNKICKLNQPVHYILEIINTSFVSRLYTHVLNEEPYQNYSVCDVF